MVLNKNIIVRLNELSTIDNGIQIQETRGKRDIVSGIIVDLDKDVGLLPGNKIYFPYYSAINFAVKGDDLWIVNINDVIMVE